MFYALNTAIAATHHLRYVTATHATRAACTPQQSPQRSPQAFTPIVNVAVNPLDTVPLIDASSSDAPSLKMPSVASDTRDRFVTLAEYPVVAYTSSQMDFGSAICDVAIFVAADVAVASDGYTSK